MNTCLTDQELQSLLEGGLSDAEMSSVGNHLATCARCRQRADDLTNVTELNWARGMRDGSSDADAAVSPQMVPRPSGDTSTARRSAKLDLDRELDWLDPPRQAGDLGAMGAYRVLRVLGQGGMGIVLLCHDGTLERLVAIKILRSDRGDSRSRERFVREARAAAAIQHDNVVTIHHVTNPPDGLPYLVMQYIAGPTLRQQIVKSERLPTREAARIAKEIADGLSAAHAARRVHRDIKPANIILDDDDGRAKIMDFGLVRVTSLEKGAQGSGVTQDGISPGTPEYMSPEQVDAPEAVDARTDVYGLGVTLYEMLTGSRPFHGPTHAVLQQVLHDDPRPPHRLNPRIPRELETICLHAMEKEPARRYESAAAMSDDLQRWLNGEAILARPGGSVQKLWRWWKRHAAFANLAVAAALLLVATSTAVCWQWHRAEKYLADAHLHRVQRDANAATAQRHREQRDAKAAEARRNREQRDAKAAEAAQAKQQVQEAAGQMLAVALTTQLSQDTRPEALERMFFEKLMTLPAAALEQKGDAPARPRDVASALLLKGGLRRQLGDWAEAAIAYEQATHSLEQLAGESPADLTLCQMLATAHQGFGEVLHALQKPDDALNSYLRARDGQLKLVRADPRALHYPLDLATSEIAIGDLYVELGQRDLSTSMFSHAQRRLRRLQHATSVSHDPRAQGNVGVAFRELGDGLRRIADTDGALYCYQQADRIGRGCLKRRPKDLTAVSELGEVQHQMGQMWSHAGDLTRAVVAYQEAATLQRRVVQSTPLQKNARQRLVRHLQAATIIHRQLGQPQKATDAIAEVQQLVPADAEQVYWCALQFAGCLGELESGATRDSDALRGQLFEATLGALRHAIEVGFDRPDDVDLAQEFAPIRNAPEFRELAFPSRATRRP